MKKILIATLALITALCISLAACDKKDKNKDDEPIDDDPIGVRPSDSDSQPTDSGNGNGTGTNVWVDKNDTVYVLTESNIRANTSTSSTKIATVPMGTALTRTQTNGTWDKITYNDQEAYIKSNLVTTNINTVTFDPVAENEQIFLHLKTSGNSANPTSVNLRKSPTSTSGIDPVCTITETITSGDVLKLIAKSRDGAWVKVSFTGTANGTTYTGNEELYCTPSYFVELSTGGSGGGTGGAAG